MIQTVPFALANERVEPAQDIFPSSKRPKVDFDPFANLIFATPVLITAPQAISRNLVWLNQQSLLPYLTKSEEKDCYIQIAGNVYLVAFSAFIEKGAIGLNKIQYRNCNKALIRPDVPLSLALFDPSHLSGIHTIVIEVSEVEPESSLSPYFLDVESLELFVKNNYDNQVFRTTQSLLMELSQGSFRLNIQNMQIAQRFFSIKPHEDQSFFGILRQTTTVKFIAKQNSSIVLCTPCAKDSIQKYHCSLELEECKESNDLERMVLYPFAIDKSQFLERLFTSLQNKPLLLHKKEELDIPTRSHTPLRLSHTLTKVDLIQKEGERKEPTHALCYEVDQTKPFHFICPSNLILIEDTTPKYPASELHFALIAISQDQKPPRWIPSGSLQIELLQLLQSFKEPLYLQKKIAIQHRDRTYVFSLKKAIPAIQEKKSFEEKFILWTTTPDTKISIFSTKATQLPLIDDRESIEVSEMYFTLLSLDESKATEKGKPLNEENPRHLNKWLDILDLQKIVIDCCDEYSEKEKLSIPIAGKSYLVECSRAVETKKRAAPSSLSPLWRISKETKIVFKPAKKCPWPIVDSSQIAVATQLTIKVKPTDIQEHALFAQEPPISVITVEQLKALVKAKMPKHFIKDAEIVVPVDEHFSLSCSMAELEQEEKEAITHSHELLWRLTDDTKIEFVNEMPTALVLQDPVIDSAKLDVDKLLLEFGLGGLASQLKAILRNVVLSRGVLEPYMKKRGIKPVKGLLLYGPPGTGKTTLARNIGKLLNCKDERLGFYSGSEFADKYFGESESKVRAMFAPAKAAWEVLKEKSPLYTIIIDEIDALLRERGDDSGSKIRDPIVNQFLTELDGLNELHNILVVGITNNPSLLDPAVTRPGRLGVHLKLDLPTPEERKAIFGVHTITLQKQNLLSEDINFDTLVERTEGYSGADIEDLIRIANSYSFERLVALNLPQDELASDPKGKITMSDLLKALEEQTSRNCEKMV